MLGALLLEPDAWARIQGRLVAADFYKEGHRRIFEAMGRCATAGHGIDLLTISESLRQAQELEEAGGPAALAQLLEEAGTLTHLESYAAIVQDKAVLRELIRVGTAVVVDAYENDRPPRDLVVHAAGALEQIARRAAAPETEPRIPVRSIGDSLARAPGDLVVRYLLHPQIPERGLVALSGSPGVGKGKLVQDFMLARASGQPFLGQDIVAGPSLFWSGEQGMDEDDRVFQAFARSRGIVPAVIRHPLFVLSDPPSQVDQPAMRDQVFQLARQHPGLLVVLDSIRRAFPGDEIVSETPDRFFRDIFVPLRSLGATVLFLAHPPKPPAQGELRPDSLLRGSGDWLAILDSFLVLKAAGRQRLDASTEDIHSTLLHVKARRGPRADEGTLTLHVTDDETPDLGFAFSFTPGGTEVTKAQVAIEALAAFFRERGRAGRRDYLKAFEGRFSERQLDPARKMLVAQGLLTEVHGGAGRASIWAWIDGTTGVDGSSLFELGSFDVPR